MYIMYIQYTLYKYLFRVNVQLVYCKLVMLETYCKIMNFENVNKGI